MSPYEMGEEAYFRGESFGDNPFPKGSPARAEWERGMSADGGYGRSEASVRLNETMKGGRNE